MATQEEIGYVLEKLDEIKPAVFFKTFNEGNAGIGAVLRFLSESQVDVTAGKISEFMNVSTARTAVLLKKMSDKGLIVKREDSRDARRTIVSLTDSGWAKVQLMKQDLYSDIENVIDKVGMKRLKELFEILIEIQDVYSPPNIDF